MSSCQKNVKYQPDNLIVQLQYQKKTYESTPNIFPTSFFFGNLPIFPTSFFGKPTKFCTSFSWETHRFFLPHFLGKLTNFSYLNFLGNPPIFLPHFFWKTHQFFLPHFLGKPTNFSYLIFLGNPPIFPTSFSWETHQFFYLIFLGNPPIWLMKLLKKLPLMRLLATISVIIWNFCKLFTMKEGTIDTYKTTPNLLSYLIRVLRNLNLKI